MKPSKTVPREAYEQWRERYDSLPNDEKAALNKRLAEHAQDCKRTLPDPDTDPDRVLH